MNHNLVKLALYFNSKRYWRLTSDDNLKVKTKLGPFFLNLIDRLEDNHYPHFDNKGYPVGIVDGKFDYNYTTICSYALAIWHKYLVTGDEKFTKELFKAVEFLENNNEETDYDGIVFPYNGKLSAMNQGEALSILARAYEFTHDENYLSFAEKIIKPYNYLVENYGVKGVVDADKNLFWYEEIAQKPYRHILNGMIYSLIGLYEINHIAPKLTSAKELFEKGIGYLEAVLPEFDTGKWSWYWLDEAHPNYIASAMYHNLHICQLRYLHAITNKNIFKFYADKFENQYDTRLSKLMAGFSLVKGKLKFVKNV